MIRFATITDKAAVTDLLAAAHQGAGFSDPCGFTGFAFPFVPAYAERLFLAHLEQPNACAIVHDVDTVPRGILMAAAVEDDFSPAMIAKETVFWIDPGYRGRAAGEMRAVYEGWARQKGCVTCSLGVKSDPRSVELFRRWGYRQGDVFVMKALS